MKKSKRIAILGICIELMLGALMVGLLLTIGQSSAETARRIGTSIGGIMGALGGFFAIYWFNRKRSGN
jgi:hypothetical protein